MSKVIDTQSRTSGAPEARFARLTALFLAPMASVALITHLYGGERSFMATMVVTALIWWLPVNPVGLYNIIAVLREREEWGERSKRLAVSWAGVLVAAGISHSYLLVGLENLHKFF